MNHKEYNADHTRYALEHIQPVKIYDEDEHKAYNQTAHFINSLVAAFWQLVLGLFKRFYH